MSQISSTSPPSSLVYSLNVPEVTNLETKFLYNFFVVDEVTNDSGLVSEDVAAVSNIMLKKLSNGSTEAANLNNTPRHIKISFTRPQLKQIDVTDLPEKNASNVLLNNIIYEEDFGSDSFTTLNIDNKMIEKQTSTTLTLFGKSFTKSISALTSSFDNTNENVTNALLIATSLSYQAKGFNFIDSLKSTKLNDLKKVKFVGQVSNNVIYDLFLFGANSYGTNDTSFLQNLNFAKIQNDKSKNLKFGLTDTDFKPTVIKYTSTIGSVGSKYGVSKTKTKLVGYLINKVELLFDGTTKVHSPIILTSGNTTSYYDYKIRYGTIYAYQVRALYDITYPANDSETLAFKMITSRFASRPEISYAETVEYIPPPPPIELNFIWNYDSAIAKPFPVTNIGGGSLIVYWSFPINRSLDIKKFQVFRRKTIDEPFELLKMIDFDNSDLAGYGTDFFSNETLIDPKVVERSVIIRDGLSTISVPIRMYFDDEFTKSSEYIYAIASVDAHGLSSNYSEQFKVSFDQFNNKIVKSLVSLSGAPKPYPNLYLQRDLFVDIIKSSNKNKLCVYFTPVCYKVTKNVDNTVSILDAAKSYKYMINFINLDNAIGTNLSINIESVPA